LQIIGIKPTEQQNNNATKSTEWNDQQSMINNQ
jgi:hypothetical protein